MRQPRSDRKPYNVYPRRGKWVGYYYAPNGDRITNVVCTQTTDQDPAPVPLPVTTDDPDRCPNHNRALEYMRQIYEGASSPRRAVPTLIAAIEEWHRSLLLAGCQVVATRDRITKLTATISGVLKRGPGPRGGERAVSVAGIGWTRLDQINKHDFRKFLGRLGEVGRAPRTRNQYLEVWCNFLDWCADDDLVKENPLATLRRAKQTEAVYDRRPFTRAEFRLLVEQGRPSNRLFYLTLGLSGLRYDEGCKVRREHLDPTAARPIWRLASKIQKVKLPETIPMSPQLAPVIAERWRDVGSQGLMFPTPPSRDVLYREFRDLGITRINDAGEHLSFHSFRCFFATEMAKILSMRKVQILMRHKSIQLTADLYAKLHLVDVDDQWDVPEINF